MALRLIACEVFYREACLAVATSPHGVDVEFTEKNAHEKSDAAEASDTTYDAEEIHVPGLDRRYEERLVLQPGQRIGGVYDWDRIVKAEKI